MFLKNQNLDFQKKGLCWVSSVALSLLFFPFEAHANVGEAYGFGSRSSALAGATAAWGFDGFAAYNNPAGVTLLKDERFSFSFGFTYNQPVFAPIDNVVTDNEFVSDAEGPLRGNVSVDDYRPTFGTVLGATLRLAPQLWNLSAGLTAFVPLKQLAYLDTGQTYVPEYVLYRARTQRPQFHFALAAEPLPGFSAGVGMQAAFNMTSNADVFVQTDQRKPTTMKFAASLKPQLIPYAGLLYVSHKNARKGAATEDESTPGAFSTGLVVRMAGSSDNDMALNTNARVLNPLPALPLNFQAASAMYYDPFTIELGGSLVYLPHARLFVQVDYQGWFQFKPPVPTITPSSGVNMSSGGPATMAPHDIVIPRVGHEYRIDRTTLRVGYSYRPSIFKGVPNDNGNYLDPDRDIITGGIGYRFSHFLDMKMPWNLDLHGTYHSMRGQQINKSSGNELSEGSGDRKIGAPGYVADGHVWGLGLSISLAI